MYQADVQHPTTLSNTNLARLFFRGSLPTVLEVFSVRLAPREFDTRSSKCLSRLRRPAETACRTITKTAGQHNATFAPCRGHVAPLARQPAPQAALLGPGQKPTQRPAGPP